MDIDLRACILRDGNKRLNELKEYERKKKRNEKAELTLGEVKSHRANEILDPELCKAIRDKDMELFLSTLETLCSEELSVSEIMDQATRSGNTVLHLATDAGSNEIVELIALHFPQLLTRTSIKGETVLHVAARTGKCNLIKTILDCYKTNCRDPMEEKLWINMQGKGGNTALHYAVMTRDINVVALLFSSANEKLILCTNKEEKSPLYLAAESREIDIIEALLQVPLSTPSSGGFSPLLAAVDKADLDFVKQLLKRRPETLRFRTPEGNGPLHWAALIGHVECVELLLREDRLSTLEWNGKGNLPVHLACKRGHVEVVQKMVEQGWLDPEDLVNKRGQNVLHIAAKNGRDKVVSYILRHNKQLGEVLNERDEDGNTPLHLASEYFHPKVLLLLIKERTLDLNLLNYEGLTARDVAFLNREFPVTFREHLVLGILYSAGATLSAKGRKIIIKIQKKPSMEGLKEQINTIMLVAILVATVSYAAGFTMPGGTNSSDDPDPDRRGMATLLNRKMFQLFTICNIISMYCSIIGSFILLFAYVNDSHLMASVYIIAQNLVGSALVTMSIAFMAAVHLVVSNLSWLAKAVLIIATMFLLVIWLTFLPLIFTLPYRNFLLRQMSYLVIKVIIPFSASYGKLSSKKKKKNELKQQSEKDQDKDGAPPKQVNIAMPEEQQNS